MSQEPTLQEFIDTLRASRASIFSPSPKPCGCTNHPEDLDKFIKRFPKSAKKSCNAWKNGKRLCPDCQFLVYPVPEHKERARLHPRIFLPRFRTLQISLPGSTVLPSDLNSGAQYRRFIRPFVTAQHVCIYVQNPFGCPARHKLRPISRTVTSNTRSSKIQYLGI